jgi:hypothetical protein
MSAHGSPLKGGTPRSASTTRAGETPQWIAERVRAVGQSVYAIVNGPTSGQRERVKPPPLVVRRRVIHEDELDEKLYDHATDDEREEVA